MPTTPNDQNAPSGGNAATAGMAFQANVAAQLVAAPPAFIRPEQITAHLSVRAAKKLFRDLWVHSSTTGSPFDVHPQILIYPALVVQRADEEFVTIVDKALGHDPIPNDSAEIEAHIEATSVRSERLIDAVQALLPGPPAPSTLTEFPGFELSGERGWRCDGVFAR